MRTIYALLCFALLSAAASAIELNYSDVNGDHTGPVFMSTLTNIEERWVFDLDNDTLAVGDINPEDTIVTANLRFAVQDDRFDLILIELASLKLDENYIGTTEVDTGEYLFNVLSWVGDHKLNVQVYGVIGDFTINEVELYGTYTDLQAPPDEPVVPEPATLSLIGLGLASAGVLRRRRA